MSTLKERDAALEQLHADFEATRRALSEREKALASQEEERCELMQQLENTLSKEKDLLAQHEKEKDTLKVCLYVLSPEPSSHLYLRC